MKQLPENLRSDLKRRLSRATRRLSEGRRKLLARSSGALTQFIQSSKAPATKGASETFPQWALLAAESWETAQSIIVRIETPGMRKQDLDVSITQRGLRVRGEKHSAGDHRMRIYSLMERAFGRFERTIPLPRNIDASKVEVSYQDGVITVIIGKAKALPPTH